MTHLDEEQIQRLLHDELGAAGDEVRAHLAACAECRSRVEGEREEERRIFELLAQVDHPLPDVRPDAVLPAAKPGRTEWVRWAAGVVLVATAAGAAYAAPGSPLPGLVRRVLDMATPVATPPGAAQSDDSPTAGAGIALAPGERLEIRFLLSNPGSVALVALTDDAEVSVKVVEGAATFASSDEQLSVRGAAPARFEVRIPRTAVSVDVLSGDVPLFRKRGREIVADALPGADGRYRLPLPPRL